MDGPKSDKFDSWWWPISSLQRIALWFGRGGRVGTPLSEKSRRSDVHHQLRPRLESASSGKASDGCSRLCDLPNEILHNILGLLPIKEAIRSCVLARRWEHLWRSMPCLILRRDSKVDFIDKVLTLRDPNHPIQRFKLGNDMQCNNRVNALITAAVEGHQAQELLLDLSTYEEPCYLLPPCIFNSGTLVKLVLFLGHDSTLRLPDFVLLPSLKVLYLSRLKIVGPIEKLLSSPLLEELRIHECSWEDTKSIITVSAPNLGQLYVRSDKHEVPPFIWMHCQSLKDVKFYVRLQHEFHVSGHSMKLDKAILALKEGTVADHGFKLLNCLSTTKRLTLCNHSCKVVDSSSKVLELAQFGNLTELTWIWFKSWGLTAQRMLSKSPSLEILTLLGFWPDTAVAVVVEDECDSVPLCSLKKVTITFTPFDGSIDVDWVGGINWVGMLLKTGTVLEEVAVWINRSPDGDRLLDILRNLPKVSGDCRISPLYNID